MAEEEEGQLTPAQEQEDELHPVSSSMVAEVGFEPDGEELIVVFNNGHEASYPADREAFEAVAKAGSVGKALWDLGVLGR